MYVSEYMKTVNTEPFETHDHQTESPPQSTQTVKSKH
jgi:hypothetical protein